MFALAVALCLVVKVAIDLYVRVPVPFFTMEHGFESGNLSQIYLVRNLNILVDMRFRPFLANGGTLVAFLILTAQDQLTKVFQVCSIRKALRNKGKVSRQILSYSPNTMRPKTNN